MKPPYSRASLLVLILAAVQTTIFLQAQAPQKPAMPQDRQIAAKLFDRLRSERLQPLDASQSLSFLSEALARTDDPVVQEALLSGMKAGLEGQRNVAAPDTWWDASAKLSSSSNPEIAKLTLELSQIFGDEEAAKKALATLQDAAAPAAERQAALRSLISQQNAQLAPLLKTLVDDEAIQLDVIRAFASVRVGNAPNILLSRYLKLNSTSQRTVIETLASREEYATALLKALKEDRVKKGGIPTYTARALSQMLGKDFTDVYGDLNALSADKEQLISKYKKLLTNDVVAKGDAHAGRGVFERTCTACHIIYGQGGKIGPDLTGSNRADLDYILLNMLDPSGDIPEAYQLVIITTKDGQILSGTISNEDDQRINLNMVGLESTVLKSDIAKRETSPYSMMPEGLLLTLPDKDVINLVKYLRSSQQVEAK